MWQCYSNIVTGVRHFLRIKEIHIRIVIKRVLGLGLRCHWEHTAFIQIPYLVSRRQYDNCRTKTAWGQQSDPCPYQLLNVIYARIREFGTNPPG